MSSKSRKNSRELAARNHRDQLALNEMIGNTMLMRQELIQRLMGEGPRDIDEECHYPKSLTFDDYWRFFKREGLASRVISFMPDECWTEHPDVYEDTPNAAEGDNPEEVVDLGEDSLFDNAWDDLVDRLDVFGYCHRVDILSGIGRYGVMFLGFDDVRSVEDLQKPVPGIEDDGLPADPTAPPRPTMNAPPYPPGSIEEERHLTGHTTTTTVNPLDVKDVIDEATTRQLLFIRVFHENQAQITNWENNPASPRFGQPKFYTLTFSMEEMGLGAAVMEGANVAASAATKSIKVHWSRVIHLPSDDQLDSEVMGTPRLENVYNYATNVKKILGADGEGFWKGGFPGLSLESQPSIENVDFGDEELDKTRSAVQDYMNGLSRYLTLVGMSAKSLAPNVTDPLPHLDAQVTAICATKGWPKRVFMGTEEAKLASGQDAKAHNRRTGRRCNGRCTNKIVRPLVDRLLMAGVLPPVEKYAVEWMDFEALTETEKADIALKQTQAMAAYVSGNLALLIQPNDYFVQIFNWAPDIVERIMENSIDNIAANDDDDSPDSDPATRVGRTPPEPKPELPPDIKDKGGKGPPK